MSLIAAARVFDGRTTAALCQEPDIRHPEHHEYELYLAIEDIDHSRIKTKSPQTNGICERFHKTVLNEFYRVALRKKVYRFIDELQADLDVWTANVPRRNADDEGENDRRLTTSDTKTRSLNQAPSVRSSLGSYNLFLPVCRSRTVCFSGRAPACALETFLRGG